MKLKNLLHIKKEGVHIVACLNPICFYKLSDIASNFINRCSTLSYEEAMEMVKSEYQTDEFQEFGMRMNKIREKLFINDEKVPKTNFPRRVSILTLNTTRKCNLKCSYCFEDKEYREMGSMSFEIAKKAIDTFFDDESKKWIIVFTGGEPLLKFDLIKDIVEYVTERGLEVEYRLKTNGTLLDDEKVIFLIDNNFKFQISLDGGKLAHDTHRVFANGKGTFDKVDEAIRNLVNRKYSSNVSISATTTHQTIGYIDDSYDNLNSYGEVHYDLKPVMPNSVKCCVLDKRDYGIAYNSLVKNGSKQIMIKSKQISDVKANVCGIGIWNITIDVDGKIYPCYRMCGDNKYVLGDLDSFSLPFKLPTELESIYHLELREKCSQCFFLTICKKGCYTDKLMTDSSSEECFLHTKNHILDILYNEFIINGAHKLLATI